MNDIYKLVCIRDVDDQNCIDRLVKLPISLLCETSFTQEDLLSEENKFMFVFVNAKREYLGFCRIMQSTLCIDRFEIFSEHRLNGYGKIFVNKIKEVFGITDYYQILDQSIGFWSKMFSSENNLFEEMLKNVIKGNETFQDFCNRLNYCDQDLAYYMFKAIIDSH